MSNKLKKKNVEKTETPESLRDQIIFFAGAIQSYQIQQEAIKKMEGRATEELNKLRAELKKQEKAAATA